MPLLHKTGSLLNRYWQYASWQLGCNRSYFTRARGSRIVIYHGICLHDPLRFNSLFITRKTFEEHLRFYKKYFQVVSLDDFYANRYDNDRFTICLSFDDGFANNYKYAVPLLQQYQLPATFFITGIRAAGYDILWNDFLSVFTRYGPHRLSYQNDVYCKSNFGRYVSITDGKALADKLRLTGFPAKDELIKTLAPFADFKNSPGEEDYWRQMSTGEIRELAASPLVTIGCHGYYHNDLSGIPVNNAAEEMADSKKFLEKITGKAIHALAFPYGAYTQAVKEQAKTLGFTQLLATEFLFPEDAQDTTFRERLTINPFISVINQMYAIVRGHYA